MEVGKASPTEDSSQQFDRVGQANGNGLHVGLLEMTADHINLLRDLRKRVFDGVFAKDSVDFALLSRGGTILVQSSTDGSLPDITQITPSTGSPLGSS
jgi:hypothetical protein